MHSVCCCSLPVWRRSFLKKGTPHDLFWPRPGSTPGRIWPKNNNTCKGPWVLHPYQVSSKSIKRFWRRSWKCESLRTDGRRTDGRTDDGRTDDGRCPMTIAHLSLWLRWAKKRYIAIKDQTILKHNSRWKSTIWCAKNPHLEIKSTIMSQLILYLLLLVLELPNELISVSTCQHAAED